MWIILESRFFCPSCLNEPNGTSFDSTDLSVTQISVSKYYRISTTKPLKNYSVEMFISLEIHYLSVPVKFFVITTTQRSRLKKKSDMNHPKLINHKYIYFLNWRQNEQGFSIRNLWRNHVIELFLSDLCRATEISSPILQSDSNNSLKGVMGCGS